LIGCINDMQLHSVEYDITLKMYESEEKVL
jgi:hypothetical protein